MHQLTASTFFSEARLTSVPQEPIFELHNTVLFRRENDEWEQQDRVVTQIFKHVTTGTTTLKITGAKTERVLVDHFSTPHSNLAGEAVYSRLRTGERLLTCV